jgi:hypothetical protein
VEESQEGWYTDPYQRHEARWMSQGMPTALVRDDGVEGSDPAPDGPFAVAPVRVESGVGPNNGADLRRVGESERDSEWDPNAGVRAAWYVWDKGHSW